MKFSTNLLWVISWQQPKVPQAARSVPQEGVRCQLGFPHQATGPKNPKNGQKTGVSGRSQKVTWRDEKLPQKRVENAQKELVSIGGIHEIFGVEL